jgi:hypothetical protein
MEVPINCFPIFGAKISYKFFSSVPPLPRCDRCPESLPLIPIVVVLCFLRYSGRLPPRSFLHLSPSLRVRYVFPGVHPFRGFGATSSLLVPDARVPCTVTFLYGGPSSCRRRPISSALHSFPWSEFSRKHLSCAVPLLLGESFLYRRLPTSSGISLTRVCSFGSPWRPTARFRVLCRFFIAPKVP